MFRKTISFTAILFVFNIFYMSAQQQDTVNLDSAVVDSLPVKNWKLKSLHSLNFDTKIIPCDTRPTPFLVYYSTI